MNILVVSDTHDNFEALLKVYEKHKDEIRLVIHLGDGLRDLYALNAKEYIGVRGNNDYSNEELVRAKEIGDVTLVLEHIPNRSYLTLENYKEKNIIYMHGHEHKLKCDEYDKLLEVSPGALTLPRDGNLPTYILMNIIDSEVNIEFYNIKGENLRNCKKKF
ncbi:MAG: metallophosphatase family protein [Clostridia bacterium]|jgi:putative phosphoesterase|nr:metallophosphatase family protein [Clostridia bacterium]